MRSDVCHAVLVEVSAPVFPALGRRFQACEDVQLALQRSQGKRMLVNIKCTVKA
jgi:hypothetical protein